LTATVACSGGTVSTANVKEDAALIHPDDALPGFKLDLPATVNLDVPPDEKVLPPCFDGGCAVPVGCGDGVLADNEECDDGNTASGDGCTAACRQETDWKCPTPGQPCISTVVCGDGRISGKEACDDRNTSDGDGCSADCMKVEPGWVCKARGMRCQPKCGDGVITGWEECDDGNMKSGDGCTEACKLEPGMACTTPGKPCHKTVCGDKVKEGSESCDDGNTVPGDGCAPDCKSEPICKGTDGCTSQCGDGLKMPDEECDDGNIRSGDGCAADCKLEQGWACQQVVEGTNSNLSLPIIYRDFMPSKSTVAGAPGHPDFEQGVNGKQCLGVVLDTLGADRKPQYNVSVSTALSLTSTKENFDRWYHDSEYSKTIVDYITLIAQPGGVFMYDHSGYYSDDLKIWLRPPFFPIDNRGWATPPDGPEIPYLGIQNKDKSKHNFSFTSELRYWFEFKGGETLQFIGDDDVWMFLNGKLAVDLGGLHEATPGEITLDDATATKFKMTKGKIYEIVIFQAERQTFDSSYKLTVGKFNRTHTDCQDRCGDGVVNGIEVCDNGVDNNDSAYGGCTTQCTLGPFCGDGTVDSAGGEECDDGTNQTGYGQKGCAPGCRAVPYCGDGKVDSVFGEACDNGALNGQSACDERCQNIIL
jgi:fibro-slime domain-containing protein